VLTFDPNTTANICDNTMTEWNICLLGEFSIKTVDGNDVTLPGKKHQALVAYVATAPDQSVSRDKMLDLLWGSRSEGQAKQSLRGVLSETNKVLRTHAQASSSESPLVSDRNTIRLTRSLVSTDVDRLLAAVRSNDIQNMISLATTRSGEFLENLKINEISYQSWRVAEAERHQRVRIELLQKILSMLDHGADSDRIVQVADMLLVIDETDEVAHRALMETYAGAGKQSLAIRQFEICKQRLDSELGVAPSAITQDLFVRIKSLAPEPDSLPLPVINASKVTLSKTLGVAVAIRPFVATAGDDQGNEYGMIIAEEIVSAAAGAGWFRVIPRNESFKSSLATLGPVELSNTLRARYVLEGRLRHVGESYGLTIDLTDGSNADTVWSERFVIESADLPYPNAVIAQITSRLDVRLRVNEIGRIHQLDSEHFTAYDCSLMALSNMYDLTPESYQNAERLFERGISLNPDYSTIHSFWCLWRMFCLGQSWSLDPSADTVAAAAIARRAIRLDPSNAMALAISAHFESFWHHDFRQGINKFDQSLSVNPYSSFAWMLSSATQAYIGRPDEALRRLRQANELCPLESPLEFMYSCAYCIAYNFNRNYEQAMEWGYRTVTENPGFTNGYKLLLVALGHLDRSVEAAQVLTKVLELDPSFNVRDFLTQYPFKDDRDRTSFQAGLLQAGVPETSSSSQKP